MKNCPLRYQSGVIHFTVNNHMNLKFKKLYIETYIPSHRHSCSVRDHIIDQT